MPTIADAVATAIGPGFVLLRPGATVHLGLAVEPTAGSSNGAIRAKAVGPKALKEPPPSRVQIVSERNASPVETARSGASAAIRAFMGRESRIEAVPSGTNAQIYDDDPYPDGRVLASPARFRDQVTALAEGQRLAALWEPERPLYTADLEGGCWDLRPGQIWEVIDPRDDSTEYVMITKLMSGTDRDRVEVR